MGTVPHVEGQITSQYTPIQGLPVTILSQVELIRQTYLQTQKNQSPQNLVKQLIDELGVNEELVYKIIKCESGWRTNVNPQNTDGSIDYGLLQVNSRHIPEMQKMNLDITNWEDSLMFGLLLLKQDGLKHWNASKYCWQH